MLEDFVPFVASSFESFGAQQSGPTSTTNSNTQANSLSIARDPISKLNLAQVPKRFLQED
ncbi:hypothetical protein PILCRDRAFT_816182 [Piloderma croceum F 1598]|uniref:Uncharacterized protein n=1 Tax=Piloderma croceum (strain F 1598) TaxID=765440 RepID=A0A0C3BIU9_PILCF|nr:hypothetical protein PILCRDRAFT_816182 [Piloderma croceum F 1598]